MTSLACTCGGVATATSQAPETVGVLERMWAEHHSGSGHAPCDPERARGGVAMTEWREARS